MNPIDAITQLRSKHSAGEKYVGVNVNDGVMSDMEKLNIVEPIIVKEQIIKSATETANMILRIDNVIAVSGSRPSAPPEGMPLG